jgi:hypothetical protein
MAYTYEQVFAADPANPANIAQNAAITIFAPGDVTMTPLSITDPDGTPLPNPIPVNANGFGSAFAHATLDRVAWAGGGFTGFFTSYEGMKQVAVDAQAAAESAAATAGTEAAAVAEAAIAGATDEATAAAASAATAATNASASATAAANAAALVGAPADTAIAAAVNNGASATKAALNATYAPASVVASVAAKADKAKLPQARATDATPIRDMVRAKQITATAPLVAIGDSHTDQVTSAGSMWDRLRTLQVLPGQGLEGLDTAAIIAKGKNGQTLRYYLDNPAQAGGYNEAIALSPSVVLACWLTNDVRTGGLGLTVAAIRAAGAARLNELITKLKTDLPNAKIILRISAPYTTVNSGTDNYITDGTNINPAGLAQIYTDGVRLANYDAAAANPGVLVYDPQTRFFGTTAPTANGGANTGYYANQIHQNVLGFQVEGDDFAAWVGAQAQFNQAAATEARLVQNPSAPWLAYHRVVEDTDRYVKVADGGAVTVTSGNTYLDFGPSFPGAIPSNIAVGDILVAYGANKAVELTSLTAIAQGANTRLLIPALTFSAGYLTRVAIYRRTTTPDDALNVFLRDRASRYKRTGFVGAGATNYLDINAKSFTEFPVLDASTWATELAAGDKVYVEGMTGSPLTIGTDTTSNAAQGNRVRLLGSLGGVDWSTKIGKAVVILGNHA